MSVLSSFKNSRAPGPDGFSVSFFKEFASDLCNPLYRILSFSLSSGKLPSCWKTAAVVPIYKKGNAADPSSYRPISLTCVACKILERIVRGQLVHFLVDNGLSDGNKFGFMTGRSATLRLLQCSDDWSECLDAGVPTDVVVIDYAKAFDSVSHQKLFFKL